MIIIFELTRHTTYETKTIFFPIVCNLTSMRVNCCCSLVAIQHLNFAGLRHDNGRAYKHAIFDWVSKSSSFIDIPWLVGTSQVRTAHGRSGLKTMFLVANITLKINQKPPF